MCSPRSGRRRRTVPLQPARNGGCTARARTRAHPTDGLDLVTARVYDALPTIETATVDEIVVESGLLPHEVLGSLAVLEMHGMTTKEGTVWRRLSANAARRPSH